MSRRPPISSLTDSLFPHTTLFLSPRHSAKVDRLAVRKDDPLPRDERARLPKDRVGIIRADKAGALRDQEIAARRGIENVLGNLRDNLPRYLRVDAENQRAGNYEARAELEAEGRFSLAF